MKFNYIELTTDILERIEERKGEEHYLSDLGMIITEEENADGSWYCNYKKAEKDIKDNFNLFMILAKDMQQELCYDVDFVNDLELAHCALMIRLYDILFTHAVFESRELLYRYDERITIDDNFIMELKTGMIKLLCKDTELCDLPLDEIR